MVLIFAGIGCLTQVIRCMLKWPYLFQDNLSVRIFGGEFGILLLFMTLAWIMLRKGGIYEEILASMHEDLSFKPAQTDPYDQLKRPRFSIFRV